MSRTSVVASSVMPRSAAPPDPALTLRGAGPPGGAAAATVVGAGAWVEDAAAGAVVASAVALGMPTVGAAALAAAVGVGVFTAFDAALGPQETTVAMTAMITTTAATTRPTIRCRGPPDGGGAGSDGVP